MIENSVRTDTILINEQFALLNALIEVHLQQCVYFEFKAILNKMMKSYEWIYTIVITFPFNLEVCFFISVWFLI